MKHTAVFLFLRNGLALAQLLRQTPLLTGTGLMSDRVGLMPRKGVGRMIERGERARFSRLMRGRPKQQVDGSSSYGQTPSSPANGGFCTH